MFDSNIKKGDFVRIIETQHGPDDEDSDYYDMKNKVCEVLDVIGDGQAYVIQKPTGQGFYIFSQDELQAINIPNNFMKNTNNKETNFTVSLDPRTMEIDAKFTIGKDGVTQEMADKISHDVTSLVSRIIKVTKMAYKDSLKPVFNRGLMIGIGIGAIVMLVVTQIILK